MAVTENETKLLNLGIQNGTVEAKIVRKDIKNVHLKVSQDGSVWLSVPMNVPSDWIDNFFSTRLGWIDKQISKFKLSSGSNNWETFRDGASTQLLGRDIRIYIQKSDKNNVVEEEKALTIFTPEPDNLDLVHKLFEQWRRNRAKELFQTELETMYNSVFRKYGVECPTMDIRKMKTLWGSCTAKRGHVTFNEYLLKAPIHCIRYVILHELTHLLYTYHNKDFYNFLTIQMPDWPERKRMLDEDTVQGL